MFIDDLIEAQRKVKLVHESIQGHGDEVWEALSPDARRFIMAEFRPRVWSCHPEPDEMSLMNILERHTSQTMQIMRQSGLGYLFAAPGNKPDKASRKVVPFPKTLSASALDWHGEPALPQQKRTQRGSRSR